ncbi:DUF2550 domain-containing protein [Sphaerimonospora cavernae]|uniref:DUF2550 domain-containing protein n=1 Tax=Sphaerimonospora cavernae TaxID=1740611 RepID=A0ABV6U564_9ACTN
MTALGILLGMLVVAALLFVRAFALAHSRGAIICRVRVRDGDWKNGVARYVGGELHWIPFLGLRLRPRRAIARRGLTVSDRRRLATGEGPAGYWAVVCSDGGGPVSLAMSEDALTGFLAWLESAPPSAYLDLDAA